MRYALFLVMAFVLSACGAGGSGSDESSSIPGSVSMKSATVANAVAPKSFGLSRIINIDAGVVSRGTQIIGTVQVQNTTGSDFNGYWHMVFDAGCNGAATWEILPLQPYPTVPPGETGSGAVGGSCGDMPLGQHTLIATLYDSDGVTVMDQAIVNFTLVQ